LRRKFSSITILDLSKVRQYNNCIVITFGEYFEYAFRRPVA